MSIYVTLDGVVGEQIASNRGWGDFCRWTDQLGPGTGHDDLLALVERGWTDKPTAVASELYEAINSFIPPPDTLTVAEGLLRILNDDPFVTIVTVTDGMGPLTGTAPEPREAHLLLHYSPNQPRVPAGNPTGGQWIKGTTPSPPTTQPDSVTPGVLAAIRQHTAKGGSFEKDYKATDEERVEMYRWVASGTVNEPVHRVLSFKNDGEAYQMAQVGKEFNAGRSGLVASWSTDPHRAPLEGGVAFVRVHTRGAITGREVSGHSVFPQEKEVLTPINSRFRVVESEYRQGSGWHVVAEQIGFDPPPRLVQLVEGH